MMQFSALWTVSSSLKSNVPWFGRLSGNEQTPTAPKFCNDLLYKPRRFTTHVKNNILRYTNKKNHAICMSLSTDFHHTIRYCFLHYIFHGQSKEILLIFLTLNLLPMYLVSPKTVRTFSCFFTEIYRTDLVRQTRALNKFSKCYGLLNNYRITQLSTNWLNLMFLNNIGSFDWCFSVATRFSKSEGRWSGVYKRTNRY